MTNDKLTHALEQIRAIVDEALRGTSRAPRKRIKAAPAAPDDKSRDKLPLRILALRDSGFLKQPQTIAEVHAKLQPIYACDINRVAVALHRLHKRRKLRKTSKSIGNKRQIAYVH